VSFLKEYSELCKKYNLHFEASSLDGKDQGQIYIGNLDFYIDTNKPFKFVECTLGNGEVVVDLVGDYNEC